MRGDDHRTIGLLALLVVVLVTGGCASTQETSTLQQSVSMLYDRQQNLERRVESSDNQAKKGGDLYARLEALQVQVGALNGRIDQLEHRIEQLNRASETRAPQTSGPSVSGAEPVMPPPLPSGPVQPSINTAPSSAAPAGPP